MLKAFLDTTAMHEAYLLRGEYWSALSRGVSAGVVTIVVSEVTVREIIRQARESAEKAAQQIASAAKRIEALGGTSSILSWHYNADLFEARYRSRLSELGIRVLPIPAVDHDRILLRDFATLAPFKRSGTGYRDTLIWHTFLLWIDPPGTHSNEFRFITNNTSDFGENGFHQSLVRDLPEGEDIALVPSLTALVNLVGSRLDFVSTQTARGGSDASEILAAVRRASESLVGNPISFGQSDFAELRVEASPLEYLDIDEATVDILELDEDSAEVTYVDSYDETTSLWTARMFGMLYFDALISKSDATSLPEGWTLADFNWSDHYSRAFGRSRVRLDYSIRLESLGGAATAEVEIENVVAI